MSFPIATVIFDFDGTLLNSMPSFARIAGEVMASYYGCDPHWAQARYLETAGLPFSVQLSLIFPQHKDHGKTITLFNRGKAHVYESCPFYEDVAPMLEWLNEKGIAAVISSNNDEGFLMNKLGALQSRFAAILGFKENFLKGRDHFRWIGEKRGIAPSSMLFVGDCPHDAQIARDCGVSFIGRLGTFAAEDFRQKGFSYPLVNNFEELKNYIF